MEFIKTKEQKSSMKTNEFSGDIFEHVIKKNPNSIFLTDKDGIFKYVNKSWEKMTGWKAEEVVGKKTPRILKSGFHDDNLYKKLYSNLSRGRSFRTEFIKKRKDGSNYIADAVIFPVKIGGKLRYFVEMSHGNNKEKTLRHQLEEEKDKYKKITSNAPLGIFQTDREGRFVFVNKSFNKILGYKANELIGKSFMAVVSAKEKNKCPKIKIGQCLTQKTFSKTLEFRRKNGQKVPVLFRISVLDLKTLKKDKKDKYEYVIEKGFVGVIQDMSAEKEHDQKIISLMERYESFYKNIPLAYFSVDKKTGRIFIANEKAAEITGYTQAKLKKMKVFDLYDETCKEKAEQLFKKFEKTGNLSNEELKIKQKSGDVLDVLLTVMPEKDEKGNIVSSRSIITDITSAKRAQRKLNRYVREMREIKEEAEYEKIFDDVILESIDTAVLAIDARDRISKINYPAEKLFGLYSEEDIGKQFFEVITLYDRSGTKKIPKEKRLAFKSIQEGKEMKTKPGEYFVYKNKTGGTVNLKISTSPLLLGGKIIGAVAVFSDISEETKIDRAKSEFVSMASHQLRTPLTVASLYTEKLLENGKTDMTLTGNQVKYLQEINIANKRMAKLIDAILDVSRIEMGVLNFHPETVNIVEVAEAALREHSVQIKEKGHDIKKQYGGNLPFIFSDSRILGIIFENLISNAIKYSPEGTEIGLKIKMVAGRKIMIEVKDEGYGISDDQKEKIFTKMFRTDVARAKSPDGTGLGLYLVRLIIEKIGGKIWFSSKGRESQEGRGTVFFVELPILNVKGENYVAPPPRKGMTKKGIA